MCPAHQPANESPAAGCAAEAWSRRPASGSMPTPSPPTTTPTREPVPAGDGGAPNRREVSAECSAPTCSSRPRSARRLKPPRRSGGSTCVVGVSNMPLPEPYLLGIAGRGLAASGAPADPGLAGSSSLSRAVISRICAGRPSRSGRWGHAGLAGRSGLGPDHATHAGVASAGSSALAGAAANPVDRHPSAAAPRRGSAAWHTQLAAVVGDETVLVDLARKR